MERWFRSLRAELTPAFMTPLDHGLMAMGRNHPWQHRRSTQTSCGRVPCACTASRTLAQVLKAQVEAFRDRPPDGGPYTLVWLDALVIRR
jgi:hypothetical protein